MKSGAKVSNCYVSEIGVVWGPEGCGPPEGCGISVGKKFYTPLDLEILF